MIECEGALTSKRESQGRGGPNKRMLVRGRGPNNQLTFLSW